MKNSVVLALSMLALAGSAVRATAEVRTITYQGVVTLGTDDVGLFGSAGLSLVGDAITSVFQYDTTLGTRATTSTSDTLTGGLDFLTASPLLSAAFTINGRSYTFEPDYYGAASVTAGSSVSEFATSLSTAEAKVSLSSTAAPASLLSSFSITGSTAGNYFLTPFDDNNNYDGITFTTTSATVGGIAAAPEPTTWSLMIGGLGFTGLMLRRRRSRNLELIAS